MKMYYKHMFRKDDILLNSKDSLQKVVLRDVSKILADEIMKRLSIEDNVYWEDENDMSFCTIKFDTADLDKEA